MAFTIHDMTLIKILFQISVLLLALQRGTSTDSCLPEDLDKIRLTGPRNIKNEGAVQLCIRGDSILRDEYLWYYIQDNSWTNNLEAANLACRELGLSYTAGVIASAVQLTEAAETLTEEIDCNSGDLHLRDCLPGMLDTNGRRGVAGLTCKGSLRLVDGSSYNEGRVEVCSNGRWGTVCGDGWTEREVSLVCTRLGFSTLNATFSNFGEGSGPLYNITCPSTGSDDQECVPIITSAPSRCNHSMDVGVRCLPFTDACEVPSQGVSSTTRSTVMSTSGTLEALIGLLAATLVVLVVVVAGWIVSCVYFQQKINKHHTHSTPVSTNNPTLQHTPHNEGDQALFDTINDNLENSDFVQCVQNKSYSLVGQRN
ncbi:neurotrypsin-like isoform X4 [Halichondria panicea]|uniref:neurotrypsin-like isoform X4 n=1 Tax=Halichondria panicea TaxID=6063 RepID=UPI00312B9791